MEILAEYNISSGNLRVTRAKPKLLPPCIVCAVVFHIMGAIDFSNANSPLKELLEMALKKGYRPPRLYRDGSCQSPYFIFALFTLLTSLLVKYSHSHPPYYLRYLRYFATFIHLAQHYHAYPLLTFFLPFTNSRIPQGQEVNRWIRKTRTAVC